MVCKVDENFFARLDESFLWKEDKSDKAKSDYILFADKDYTDKEYYKKYQTIYHLRKHLLGQQKKLMQDLYILHCITCSSIEETSYMKAKNLRNLMILKSFMNSL